MCLLRVNEGAIIQQDGFWSDSDSILEKRADWALETMKARDGVEWNSALTQIWDGSCSILRSYLERASLRESG